MSTPEINRVLTEQVEILKQVIANKETPHGVQLDIAQTIGILTLIVALFKDTK